MRFYVRVEPAKPAQLSPLAGAGQAPAQWGFSSGRDLSDHSLRQTMGPLSASGCSAGKSGEGPDPSWGLEERGQHWVSAAHLRFYL